MEQKTTTLRSLVRGSWGKSSTFMIGINYTMNSGHIWTSLALKKESKSLGPGIPLPASPIDDSLFQLVPQWVQQLMKMEDATFIQTQEPLKDRIDLFYVGSSIRRSEFQVLFSLAVSRNASLFLHSCDHELSLEHIKELKLQSGTLYVVNRADFNHWLDHLGEVA